MHSLRDRGGGGLATKSCPTLGTPWTVACQAPLSMDSPGKNTGVGCHFLFQMFFLSFHLFLVLPGFLLCYISMFKDVPHVSWASLAVKLIKNLLAMQETQVRSLGQKDPLEKEMATHSSILAWRIHGQRSLASYSPWGPKSWT